MGFLTYSPLNLGLNNQKLALFGLFLKAKTVGSAILLPELVNYVNAKAETCETLPFFEVYAELPFRRMCKVFDVEVYPQTPETIASLQHSREIEIVEGWHCFMEGSHRLAEQIKKGGVDSFAAQFFAAMRPLDASNIAFTSLKIQAFLSYKIPLAIQLRIENDWKEYSDKKALQSKAEESYYPEYLQILRVVKSHFNCSKVYMVNNEQDLPAPKAVIKAEIFNAMGISAFWKSDLMAHIVDYDSLTQSIIDFEMALNAPYFIGTSRSTFSNMACLETYARSRANVCTHYIYNMPSMLEIRMDNGLHSEPQKAIN